MAYENAYISYILILLSYTNYYYHLSPILSPMLAPILFYYHASISHIICSAQYLLYIIRVFH